MAGAVDKAYRELRDAVLRGTFAMGARLKEVDLAQQIGVSRTPVREALRRLNAEGYVQFTDSQRAAVVSFSRNDVSEVFRLRAMLEGHASALAATLISQEDIKRLITLSRAMENASGEGKYDRISKLNGEFHKTILGAANSPRLEILMRSIVELPIILRTFFGYSPAELKRSFGHHRELIAAFQASDPEWAESVMRAHISAARAVYMRGQGDFIEENKSTNVGSR